MFPRGDSGPPPPRAGCCHGSCLSCHRRRLWPPTDPLTPLITDFLSSALPPAGASSGVERGVMLVAVWVNKGCVGVEYQLTSASFPLPGASANKHKPWIDPDKFYSALECQVIKTANWRRLQLTGLRGGVWFFTAPGKLHTFITKTLHCMEIGQLQQGVYHSQAGFYFNVTKTNLYFTSYIRSGKPELTRTRFPVYSKDG